MEPFLVGPLLTSTVSLSAALPALRPPEVLGGRDLAGLACLLASLPLGLAALAAFAMLPSIASALPIYLEAVVESGGLEVACAISWPTLCEYAALALGLLGVTYFYGLKASAAAAGASYLAASAFDIALHAYKCGCYAPELIGLDALLIGMWWNVVALSAMMLGMIVGVWLRGSP